MKLYIKYMVSQRCKMLVRYELERLGLTGVEVDLGVAEIPQGVSGEQRILLAERLHSSGLEIIVEKKEILIERIKNVIIEMVHYSDQLPKVNFSEYISQHLNYDYTYLSNIFSEEKGITIQQFIIRHKIEKVKELLLYRELNMSEIAYQLHYSSVAHLSTQFKKVTGLSPSFYKKMKVEGKPGLEAL